MIRVKDAKYHPDRKEEAICRSYGIRELARVVGVPYENVRMWLARKRTMTEAEGERVLRVARKGMV